MKRSPRVARRKVLVALGAVAAGASVATACTIRPQTGASSATPLEGLVGSLGTWRVEQVMPLVAGAVPVLLRSPEGKRVQVDVMRADPEGPPAIAQAGALALYVVNGGAGDTPSGAAETHGARALAARLAEIEAEGGLPAIPGLLTLSERMSAHRQAVLTPWA